MPFTEREIAQYTALLTRYPAFRAPDDANEDEAAEYRARRLFCPYDHGLTNSCLGKASLKEEIHRSKGGNRVLYLCQGSPVATVVPLKSGEVH